MRKIISNKVARIIANKKALEENLEVKISRRGREVFVEGSPEKEFSAQKVVDALNFGFPFEIALTVLNEDVMFEIINIKDHTKRKKLKDIRARIIGTEGSVLNTLGELTECSLVLNGNDVGIIGNAEHMKKTQSAVISLIQGAKHANVYAFLEKHQPEKIVDLGIKENLGRKRKKEKEVENKEIKNKTPKYKKKKTEKISKKQ